MAGDKAGAARRGVAPHEPLTHDVRRAMKRGVHFFMTGPDLRSVLDLVEAKLPLKYVRADHSDTPAAETYSRGGDIPDLGKARTSSAASSAWFLVAARERRYAHGPSGRDSASPSTSSSTRTP
jgi:hypothetical protein